MNQKIVYQYPLPPQGPVEIFLPIGSEILTVREQADGEGERQLVMGVLQPYGYSEAPTIAERHKFLVVPTGEPIMVNPDGQPTDPSGLRYIGTAELNGWYIAHVFEVVG